MTASKRCILQLVFCQFPGRGGNFFGVGQKALLEWRSVGDRGIERGDAHNRSVQIRESTLAYNGSDFPGDAAGARVFVNDQSLFVFFTEARMASRSRGRSVRRSITSASIPSLDSCSAASSVGSIMAA